jgi:hypothetical protein
MKAATIKILQDVEFYDYDDNAATSIASSSELKSFSISTS